jgi:hypothetical protein
MANPVTQPATNVSSSLRNEIDHSGHEHHRMGAFSTFTEYPLGLSFIRQENDEEIVLFFRKHFITNFPWILGTFLLLAAPPLLVYMLQIIQFSPTFLSPQFQFLLLLFYYLIVVGYAFANFLSWFYNIGLVTTKRAIDLDFTNLSSISFATTELESVVDVHFTQVGFAQQFFNYGDVILQTDSRQQNFNFERSPQPAQAVNIISKLTGSKD